MARAVIALDAETAPEASAPPRWLGTAVGALAALHFAFFAWWLVVGAVLKPYSDGYSFIFDAWRWRDGAVSLPAYLWAPHVGHHMVWVRLVAAFEVMSAHSTWPSVVACTTALAAAAAILAWRAWGDARLTALRLPSALLCAMLVLTAFNALDADQPLNALYPFCLVFAVASLSLFTTGDAATQPGAIARALAILAAMAAALGNGAALGLWPVLLTLAIAGGKRPILWSLIVVAVGSAFSAAYLAGAGQIEDLDAGGGGDGSPVRRVLYFFDYIALPWSQLSALGGAVLGMAILAVAGWAIAVSRTRGPTPLDRFAWGLILFTVVTAALAAAGRGGLGAELRTPMRYAVFAAPLQAGVVVLLAPEVERRFAGRGWAVAMLALGAAGLLVVQQLAGGVFVMRSANKIRATIADYEAGRRTPIMTQLIYPDLIFANRVEARLRAEGSFGKAPRELAAPAPAPIPSAGGRTP